VNVNHYAGFVKTSKKLTCAVIGCALLSFPLITFGFFQEVENKQGQSESSGATKHKADTTVTFQFVLVRDGKLGDGTWFKEFVLKAPDGHEVLKRSYHFESMDRIAEEARSNSKLSDRVLSRTPELDKKGTAIGERILTCAEKEKKERYTLRSSRGSSVQEIRGTHLEDVLLLETAIRDNSLLLAGSQ
jgi:hypothetical protein